MVERGIESLPQLVDKFGENSMLLDLLKTRDIAHLTIGKKKDALINRGCLIFKRC